MRSYLLLLGDIVPRNLRFVVRALLRVRACALLLVSNKRVKPLRLALQPCFLLQRRLPLMRADTRRPHFASQATFIL